jgi:hypothetical protein
MAAKSDTPRETTSADDDVERWAERERNRRRAWAEGPTEAEKREWARGRRETARPSRGGPTMTLYPSDEDVEAWAEEERKRRQAWLAGPSAAEKHDWAMWERSTRGPGAIGPTDEEVDDWAESERRRRQAWLDGPSEAEKEEWVRERDAEEMRWDRTYRPYGRKRYDRYEDDRYAYRGPFGYADEETVRQLRRDAWLMRVGALYSLREAPFRFAAALRGAGLEWEDRFCRPERRERVRLYDRYDRSDRRDRY